MTKAKGILETGAMKSALATIDVAVWPKDKAFMEARQPAAIGAQLVCTIHRHLLGASIAYVFRESIDTRDKTVLAKASKAGSKLAFFTGYDLCIDVNHEAWFRLSDAQRVALMDHELCHFGVEETDEGERYVLLSHDVEEFGAIVNRWGLWKPDLQAFGKTCAQSDLFAGANP